MTEERGTARIATDESRGAGQEPLPKEKVPVAPPGLSQHASPESSPAQSPAQAPVGAAAALTIVGLRSEGSGCPAGSVASNTAADGKAFTLLFSQFFLAYDPAVKQLAPQLHCQVTLDLTTPAGWQVTVLTVDYRGFADLPAGAEAELDTGFSFVGSRTATQRSLLRGPLSDNFNHRAAAVLGTASWSRCEGRKTLTVNLRALLRPAVGQPAALAVDSVDGELHHRFGLLWQRCSP